MAEQYLNLYSLQQNRYIADCPIILVSGMLQKRADSVEESVRLIFRNLAQKRVLAVKLDIAAYDAGKNRLQGRKDYTFVGVNAGLGEEFGEDTRIVLPDAGTRFFDVFIQAVMFEDDLLWVNDQAKRMVALPKLPVAAEVFGHPELLKQYHMEINDKAVYIPKQVGDLWMCSCGMPNYENTCYHCGAHHDTVFAMTDMNYFKKLVSQRLATEAIAAQNKERRKKLIPIIAAALAALALIVALLVVRPWEALMGNDEVSDLASNEATDSNSPVLENEQATSTDASAGDTLDPYSFEGMTENPDTFSGQIPGGDTSSDGSSIREVLTPSGEAATEEEEMVNLIDYDELENGPQDDSSSTATSDSASSGSGSSSSSSNDTSSQGSTTNDSGSARRDSSSDTGTTGSTGDSGSDSSYAPENTDNGSTGNNDQGNNDNATTVNHGPWDNSLTFGLSDGSTTGVSFRWVDDASVPVVTISDDLGSRSVSVTSISDGELRVDDVDNNRTYIINYDPSTSDGYSFRRVGY